MADKVPSFDDLVEKPPPSSAGNAPDIGNLADKPPDKETKAQSERRETAGNFLGGAVQGAVFDPVTGIDQLIEHATDNKIGLPDSVKDWLENYKKQFTSTTAGKWGRGAGTIGSLLIPGGAIAKGISWLPKAGRSLTALEKIAMGMGTGGAGAVMQPVEGEKKKNFAKEKEAQLLGGTLAGGAVGPAAVGGAGYLLSDMVAKLGWPATIGLISSLGYLASHYHNLGGAARQAGKLVERPGGQFAAGRAAGAYVPDIDEKVSPNDQ